ncbi:MAG: hypothetical protein RM347_019460 [Nostoc sp. ChiQUE02]|nr:hypothetical protein [Nostoc sp. ChiQUE02]MDZ8231589.1 hypothetical protein [Nostoc sp. ChiQUE02]
MITASVQKLENSALQRKRDDLATSKIPPLLPLPPQDEVKSKKAKEN